MAVARNNLIFHWLLTQLNTPYHWGGQSPLGTDCSGLALQMLNSFGFKLPDMTSQGLYDWCIKNDFRGEFTCGALCFYGKSTDKITHVSVCINDDFCIEAGGGDRNTDTIEEAVQKGAFVRVRPIRGRGDFLKVFLPEYPLNLII